MLKFWLLFGVLLTLAAVLTGWSRMADDYGAKGPPPGEIVSARVDRIGLAEDRYEHDMVVVFSTPDGLVGQKRVSGQRQSCHVGDTIRAVKRGVLVMLQPGVCEK